MLKNIFLKLLLLVIIECHCNDHRFDSDKSSVIKTVLYLKYTCQFGGETEDKSVQGGGG